MCEACRSVLCLTEVGETGRRPGGSLGYVLSSVSSEIRF